VRLPVSEDTARLAGALAKLDPEVLEILDLSIRRRFSDWELARGLDRPVTDVRLMRDEALARVSSNGLNGKVDTALLRDALRVLGRPEPMILDGASTTAPEPLPAGRRFPPRAPERAREWTAALAGRVHALAVPRAELLLLGLVMAAGGLLRVWEIDAVGLNSDEAVYAGQGASIAGDEQLAPYFPAFRAHPLLFQTLLSIGFEIGQPEVFGRCAAAVLGVATVLLTYLTGRLLYGRTAGLVAGAILALMPYHVVVTRQILLDGPMVLWSTATLYMLARYARSGRPTWFYAAAGAMGLTFLSKEGSIILLGSVYAFLALTPSLRIGLRHVAGAGALFAAVITAFPLALAVAGKTETGGSFVAWQLSRRANHDWLFYPTVVPLAMGLLVVLAAGLGVWLLRDRATWRETLLLSWIAVPVAFFQVFPVKGYQYLLPIAPAVAILAARFVAFWEHRRMPRHTRPAVLGLLLVSLLVPAWQKVQPSTAPTLLAGSGGLPGGREAGTWIARNVPVGARMMSIGPSMANVLQYYGHRKIYGLSVSPNPLNRNPVYEAMKNPDRLIRDNEVQYVVWDSFSAKRSPFFARKVIRYVERYNGHVAHATTLPVESREGHTVHKPVIVIYEVRP
jgi:dolichyl-phosphate-mannose-protein mannosyltransferase